MSMPATEHLSNSTWRASFARSAGICSTRFPASISKCCPRQPFSIHLTSKNASGRWPPKRFWVAASSMKDERSHTARSYLPVTVGVGIAAGISTGLVARIGTRPIIIAGAVIGAGGVYWLSKIPVHGSYLADLLPGLVVMALGLGAVMVGVHNAANAGVSADKAGLAAALITTSATVGAALGLAILTAIAT